MSKGNELRRQYKIVAEALEMVKYRKGVLEMEIQELELTKEGLRKELFELEGN